MQNRIHSHENKIFRQSLTSLQKSLSNEFQTRTALISLLLLLHRELNYNSNI